MLQPANKPQFPFAFTVSQLKCGYDAIDSLMEGHIVKTIPEAFTIVFDLKYVNGTFYQQRQQLRNAPAVLLKRFMHYGDKSKGSWSNFLLALKRRSYGEEEIDTSSDDENCLTSASAPLISSSPPLSPPQGSFISEHHVCRSSAQSPDPDLGHVDPVAPENAHPGSTPEELAELEADPDAGLDEEVTLPVPALCEFCDKEIPQNLPMTLLAQRAKLFRLSWPESSDDNPAHRESEIQDYIPHFLPYCSAHERLSLLARRAQATGTGLYPVELNFVQLPARIFSLLPTLIELVRNPHHSPLFVKVSSTFKPNTSMRARMAQSDKDYLAG